MACRIVHDHFRRSRRYFVQKLIFNQLVYIDFVALGIARQSIVAAVGGGTTIIANVVIAQRLNREFISKNDYIGMSFIVIAVVLLAFSADTVYTFTIDQAKNLVVEPIFLGYVVAQIFVAFSGFIALEQNSSLKRYWPYYYAALAGLVGAMSVLFGKCTSVLLIESIYHKNQFNDPISFFFAFEMIAFVLLQIYILNLALATGDILRCFPIFQVHWIAGSIIGEVVFFQDWKQFSIMQWSFYTLAIAMVAYGTCCLVQNKSENEHTRETNIVHLKEALL